MLKIPVSTQHLVVLFTREHLNLRQIAARVGMSHTAVSKRLHKAGVSASAGTQPTLECEFCGRPYRVPRCRARKSRFCTPECYHASLESSGYKPWRHGQRLARAIIAQYHRFNEGEIVHHVDGDDRNNDLANLEVYASQSDHLATHRDHRPVEPVWKGIDHRR